MILRLLLILLLVWAAYRAVKYLRGPDHQSTDSRGEPTNMVRCDYCGTHVPANAAIRTSSGNYCCPEHERQGPAR